MQPDLTGRIEHWIRPVTIGTGVVAILTLVPLYLIGFTGDGTTTESDANSLDALLFNALVFGIPLAWFAFNGLRWLQERLLPPIGWLALAALAVSAFLLGGAAIILGIVELNDQSNSAGDGGIGDEVFQIALGATAIAVGGIASASALLVYARELDPATRRVAGLVRRVIDAPSYRGASERIASISRWLAIAGGVLFALAFFTTPLAVAPAIALTCLVRYVATLDTSQSQRLATAAIAAVALIAIPTGNLLVFEESMAVVPGMAFASAVVMIVALVLGVIDRPPAGVEPARSDAAATIDADSGLARDIASAS